jgi:hypothetical protein
LLLNAQSTVGKIDELSCTASEYKPDLILVTESWCHTGITDAFLKIPGYEIQPDVRKDRKDTVNGVGGGLLVYTRCGTTFLSINKGLIMEQYCSFRLTDSYSNVEFSLVYRSPNSRPEAMDELVALVR